ncbi:hypothetical protein CC1G_08936 [Coprinopsis cinerea okayama7|uniref:Uncharacterized protein n=1 Tax=Coprinopsis cinerea (strain Okayama-7 / 130 / ATCC MYA-4618 / FGSC 9003) TaxID=240176 RepID=A8P4M7_COPC7|nr:hypothetical protein CC1G_08936 [Coprinopsis cinerea okayama7\|eukprot:XP_001838772.2 hypothetical protein CC1G_08936 [Coprinopsis cinerea okayama7\
MDTPAPGGMPLMFRRKRRSKRDIDGVVQSFQRVYDVTRAYGNAMRILTLLREVMQSRVDLINEASCNDPGCLIGKKDESQDGRCIVDPSPYLQRGTQKLLNNLEHNLVARQSAVRETLGMFSTIMDRKMAGFSSQLAEDARKDSSSMTTIALLTMFFLPGSVVASFFSTHFIRVIETQTETSSDGESVETRTKIKPLQVSSTIWVYFAVTTFLTLLVLSVWLYLHASIDLPRLGIRGGDGGGDPRPWQPKREAKANADAKSESQVNSEESEKKHGVEGDARVDVVEKLETSDPD